MLDLIIQGGRVVTPTAVSKLDIGIQGQQIVTLGLSQYMAEARETINAAGLLVLPGLVDPSAHLNLPWGDDRVALEDVASNTRAAAAAGVTTILDFATQFQDHLPLGALKRRRRQAVGQMQVDFGLHLTLTRMTPTALSQIEEMVSMGIPSFKTYMTYPQEGFTVDDGGIVSLLETMQGMCTLWGNHAENAAINRHLRQHCLSLEQSGARFRPRCHPPLAEAEAINRSLFLARQHGVAYYNFHLSSAMGMDLIRRSRAKGQPVYAQTCPRYLLLTEDKMVAENGVTYICVPPLRTDEDRDALWAGLADGSISVVSSDEGAYSIQQRPGDEAREHLTRAPESYPGFEFTLPLLYSRGVETGRISLNRMVQLLSANPARIFGLFPQKGAILPGSDADLVIMDPMRKTQLGTDDSPAGTAWFPYAGLTVSGWPPEYTLLRGQVMAQGGKIVSEEKRGRFLHRRLARTVLQSPVV